MRKIRVLQFICPTGFYGAERWILALAKHLDRTRVDYHLAVTQESDDQDLTLVDRFKALSLPTHVIPLQGRFDPRLLKELKHLITGQDVDIIHTHGYKSDITGLLAAKSAGIKCLATPHGFENARDLKLRLYMRLGCVSLRFFDVVAPLSLRLLEDMRRIGVPQRKTKLILNGVDVDELEPFVKETRDRTEQERKIVGHVGQLASRKNVIDLIRAFDLVYQDHQNTELWLIGDGPQREWLESKAATSSSCGHIRFWGYRGDRLQLMRQCDVICLTSTLEGIPRVLLEAMTIGVPVLAYSIPGVTDVVTHGQTGFLVPSGEVGHFSKSLRSILFDPNFINGVVEGAKQQVKQNFSAERMAKQYLEVYKKLLGTNR